MSETYGQFLTAAAKRLAAVGVEPARREARLLLAQALGLEPGRVFTHPESPLDPAQAQSAEALLERRLSGEPLSRIRGEREFWSLAFKLSPQTLDPRPDSEILVEALLAALPDKAARLSLLDFGTGSGCLLLALLSELPAAQGLGVDISPEAVAVAKENAELLELVQRAEFRVGNWGEGVEGAYDAILSNPPYIASAEIETLDPAVRRFDPLAALDGGADGLAAYRALLPQARRLLKPDGLLALEMGWEQEEALTNLLKQNGFSDISLHRDLAGRPRCLLSRLN
jgi:release factor glutamine methyltransferase